MNSRSLWLHFLGRTLRVKQVHFDETQNMSTEMAKFCRSCTHFCHKKKPPQKRKLRCSKSPTASSLCRRSRGGGRGLTQTCAPPTPAAIFLLPSSNICSIIHFCQNLGRCTLTHPVSVERGEVKSWIRPPPQFFEKEKFPTQNVEQHVINCVSDETPST